MFPSASFVPSGKGILLPCIINASGWLCSRVCTTNVSLEVHILPQQCVRRPPKIRIDKIPFTRRLPDLSSDTLEASHLPQDSFPTMFVTREAFTTLVVLVIASVLGHAVEASEFPFSLGVRDSLMIAHSFHNNPRFGPAGSMHGATYTCDVEFLTKTLDPETNWVIDIGKASDIVSDVLVSGKRRWFAIRCVRCEFSYK